jgi:exosortase C (VPDSG-CTERM-specific)
MTSPASPSRYARTLADWWRALPLETRAQLKLCALAIAVITLAFAKPLAVLVKYAVKSELHSHILLIPFVSAYLLATRRERLATGCERSPGWTAGFIALGAAALAYRWTSTSLSRGDEHTWMALGYVCFVVAAGFAFLGRRWMTSAVFPASFLIFMVPLPHFLVDSLETASKLASAEVAHWFFELSGTPNFREGTVFQLPTITIEVAQECSGIRSSFVLLITGILAAELFLKSTWRRLVLVLLVIPLGIVRNGFRILVIGMLCVHVGPHMIDSIIHHRGGPLFFVLSVMVLTAVLWWLRRSEIRSLQSRSQGESH